MTLSELDGRDKQRISMRWIALNQDGFAHFWSCKEDFVLWSVNHGYTPISEFVRRDGANTPEKANDFRWKPTGIPKEIYRKWDDAIGLIRARNGMPPIAIVRSPCDRCRKAKTCDDICKKRAAYWDWAVSTIKNGGLEK